MKRRMVVKTESGEVFIETPAKLWRDTQNAWMADSSKSCPMPKGHLMFRRPDDYGCARIESVGDAQGGV